MSNKVSHNPADYIVPLNINGLEGRMLHLPAPATKQASNREILYVYGSHSSLERWWGLDLVLNRFGAVTCPDLPGFGGMGSFFKIGKKPTLDNMADYLAAFVKLKFRRKKFIIVGLSYGFIVATRMLQRYPELTKNVTLMISLAGFAHKDDFIFSKPRHFFYIRASRMLSYRVPAVIFKATALNPWLLRKVYRHTVNAKHKFSLAKDIAEIDMLNDVEVKLWRDNDVRTWGYTNAEFLALDNCQKKVNLPLWHVYPDVDHYFDHSIVDQHLNIIFDEVESIEFKMGAHSPSVMAKEKDAAVMIPPKLRQAIKRLK